MQVSVSSRLQSLGVLSEWKCELHQSRAYNGILNARRLCQYHADYQPDNHSQNHYYHQKPRYNIDNWAMVVCCDLAIPAPGQDHGILAMYRRACNQQFEE